MNDWERWSKRLLKGIAWAVAMNITAWALGIPFTLSLVALLVMSGVLDLILNDLIPTNR